MDCELLIKLVDIPDNLDRKQKKTVISKATRQLVTERDSNTCQLCGLKGNYGNPNYDIKGKLTIHHIIPNGTVELDNLVTLCKYCHGAIHILLYSSGKWKYVPLLK